MLGALLVLEGAGKLLAPSGYFAALGRFGVVTGGAAMVTGAIWMALELAAGAMLLVAGLANRPPRRLALAAAVVALVLQLAYATLSTQAYARGLAVDNCTCFGVYLAQRLSWFVLVQDAYMIVFAALQLPKIARWRVQD